MSHAIDIDTAIAFWAAELRRDGYCIIPELLPRESVEALDVDVAVRFTSTPFGPADRFDIEWRVRKLFRRSLTRRVLLESGCQ